MLKMKKRDLINIRLQTWNAFALAHAASRPYSRLIRLD